jgi:chromosome segregation ATPase
VLVSVPDHGASFNNLGVILWKQNRQMEALRYYEQAMLALQVNKTVLDNISEALNALPEDQRSNPLAVRVAKEFADQDTQLQAIMAQKGLHRWGSAWVDQETLDKLKAAEADVKDKLAKLEDDVKADKARIAEIDSSIDANTRAMTQIESQSFMRDTKGNMYQVPYPATYYTMQNDNEKLTAERAQKVADIQSIIEKGRQIQQSLPVAQYTGVMRLIGVEGTPFPAPVLSTAPATPATAPATPPSMMPLP